MDGDESGTERTLEHLLLFAETCYDGDVTSDDILFCFAPYGENDNVQCHRILDGQAVLPPEKLWQSLWSAERSEGVIVSRDTPTSNRQAISTSRSDFLGNSVNCSDSASSFKRARTDRGSSSATHTTHVDASSNHGKWLPIDTTKIQIDEPVCSAESLVGIVNDQSLPPQHPMQQDYIPLPNAAPLPTSLQQIKSPLIAIPFHDSQMSSGSSYPESQDFIYCTGSDSLTTTASENRAQQDSSDYNNNAGTTVIASSRDTVEGSSVRSSDRSVNELPNPPVSDSVHPNHRAPKDDVILRSTAVASATASTAAKLSTPTASTTKPAESPKGVNDIATIALVQSDAVALEGTPTPNDETKEHGKGHHSEVRSATRSSGKKRRTRDAPSRHNQSIAANPTDSLECSQYDDFYYDDVDNDDGQTQRSPALRCDERPQGPARGDPSQPLQRGGKSEPSEAEQVVMPVTTVSEGIGLSSSSSSAADDFMCTSATTGSDTEGSRYSGTRAAMDDPSSPLVAPAAVTTAVRGQTENVESIGPNIAVSDGSVSIDDMSFEWPAYLSTRMHSYGKSSPLSSTLSDGPATTRLVPEPHIHIPQSLVPEHVPVIVYWVSSTFRLKDNYALNAACWLASKLRAVVVAATTIEEASYNEFVQATKNSPSSIVSLAKATAHTPDPRNMGSYVYTKSSITRRSLCRFSILESMRESLAERNIPLVCLREKAPAATAPAAVAINARSSSFHTTDHSTKYAMQQQQQHSAPLHPITETLLFIVAHLEQKTERVTSAEGRMDLSTNPCARVAAFVTDDSSHPIVHHVCTSLAQHLQVPQSQSTRTNCIPVVSVDSDDILPNLRDRDIADSDLPSYFDAACRRLLSAKALDGGDGGIVAPESGGKQIEHLLQGKENMVDWSVISATLEKLRKRSPSSQRPISGDVNKISADVNKIGRGSGKGEVTDVKPSAESAKAVVEAWSRVPLESCCEATALQQLHRIDKLLSASPRRTQCRSDLPPLPQHCEYLSAEADSSGIGDVGELCQFVHAGILSVEYLIRYFNGANGGAGIDSSTSMDQQESLSRGRSHHIDGFVQDAVDAEDRANASTVQGEYVWQPVRSFLIDFIRTRNMCRTGTMAGILKVQYAPNRPTASMGSGKANGSGTNASSSDGSLTYLQSKRSDWTVSWLALPTTWICSVSTAAAAAAAAAASPRRPFDTLQKLTESLSSRPTHQLDNYYEADVEPYVNSLMLSYPLHLCTGTTKDELFNAIQIALVHRAVVPRGLLGEYWMAYWLTRLATPELGLRMAVMEVCTHALCSAEDSATLVTGVLALAKKVMQRAEKLTASQSSSLSSAATRAAAAASSSSLLMHPVLESIRSDIDNSSLWDDISIKRFITHMNALADEVKKL